MATNSIAISKDVEAISFWQGAVVVLGRFFFTLIFTIAARQRPVKHAATVLVFVWNWKRTDAKRRK